MNDKMIPADLVERLHDLAGKWATSAPFAIENDVGSTLDQCADELRALLPAPALPTLADMTEEERTACQWMQADIIGGDEPLVIARIDRTDWSAVILDRNGRYDEVPAGAVTPRPDLPRMEWPAEATVPPNTLTEGSQWDDGDKLSRACDASGRDQIVVTDKEGDVSVWGQNAGWWEGSTPTVGYEPFTIMHDGKKADQ